jgi:hypothetical protein
MSTDGFAELPPELISLLPPTLSTGALNALALTCRRLHAILQPELEARITPELGKELLFWAANSKPHIVAKLLAPPHLIKPNEGYESEDMTPLHVAVEAGNTGIAALLLDAGADPAASCDQEERQPLHSAVWNNNLPTVRLLLDRGANVDAKYGCDGWSLFPLHEACRCGYLEMVSLLLERGANMELRGHNGTALGFALHEREMDVIKLLLLKGAKAEVPVPLNGGWMSGGLPQPHKANLLYVALGLRHPRGRYSPEPPPEEGRKERIALLLAYKASKNETMKIIFEYLKPLAEAAETTEKEFLELVQTRFKEAEAIIGDVATTRQVWAYRAKAGVRTSGRVLPFIRRLGKKKRVSSSKSESSSDL